jgi:hypothetical protein
MAKQIVKEKTAKKKTTKEVLLSLEPVNYKIIVGGVLLIIVGYLALSVKPYDSVMSLDVAPILLVFGYCVVIPFGIIYRKKKTAATEETAPAAQNIS